MTVLPAGDGIRGKEYRYDYTLSNGPRAGEAITTISMATAAFAPGTDAHRYVDGQVDRLWMGAVGSVLSSKQRELDNSPAREILWVSEWTEDLRSSDAVNILPGRTKSGFVVTSALMPAFTTVAFSTPSPPPPPDEVMDQEIWEQVKYFQAGDYFDVTALTFGPMFLPGAEPAEVLKNYVLGVQRLMKCNTAPRSNVFLRQILAVLNEPGIEMRLEKSLSGLKTAPAAPIELELMDCLHLVARAFSSRNTGGR